MDMTDEEWERYGEMRESGTKYDLTKSGERLFSERHPHGTPDKPQDKSEKRREKKNRRNARVAAKGTTKKKARNIKDTARYGVN